MWTKRTEYQWSHLSDNPNRKHTGSLSIQKPSMINILALQRATYFWEDRKSYLKEKWCFHRFLLRLCTCYDFWVRNAQHVYMNLQKAGFQLAGDAFCLLTTLWKFPSVLSPPHPPPLMRLQSLKTYFAFSVTEPEAKDTQTQPHRTDLRWTYSNHNVPVKIRCGPGRSKVKI